MIIPKYIFLVQITILQLFETALLAAQTALLPGQTALFADHPNCSAFGNPYLEHG